MKKTKRMSLFAAIAVAVMTVLTPSLALAAPADEIRGGVDSVGGGEAASLESNLETIVNLLLFVLGAIAVIMIVIGGIRYATSNGDSSAITSAKNTILYSVIGLVVAIMAYAIVNFVIDAF
ncbi:MAG TPA: TrbC/VirB2 family protein [Candidatus Saccharimonadales bacterium]|nr:TrbC/VirB2 family protein [Candidatus Saccharimonadales bacterium]